MELEIDHLARLAQLQLSEDQHERFREQLGQIIAYVQKLDELSERLEGVEPTVHAIPLATPFREDVVGNHLSRDETFANAPEHDDTAFIVPKVV